MPETTLPLALPSPPAQRAHDAWAAVRTMTGRSWRLQMRQIDGLLASLALPVMVMLADPQSFDAATRRLGGRVVQADRSALTVAVATGGGAAEIRGLLDEIDPQRSRVTRFSEHRTSLDDVFAALTGPRTAVPVMETAHA